MNPTPTPALSTREAEVLAHVAAGLSNAEIGRRLYLAVDTVKTHLRRTSAKLGTRGDRTHTVIVALHQGLIPPHIWRDANPATPTPPPLPTASLPRTWDIPPGQWVRLGDAPIEIRATGRQPVHLAWRPAPVYDHGGVLRPLTEAAPVSATHPALTA